MREHVEHVLVFFQCGWRVRSDGAACKFADIRALPPADAPFGRDMKCVRCVACVTARQWSALDFCLSVCSLQLECWFGVCKRHALDS